MSPVHGAKHYMQTHVPCTWSQALHADTCPLYMEPSTTCRHMSPVHGAKHHYMQTHVPCTWSQALHADTCPQYMQSSTTCRHMSPVHGAKHYMQTHVPCTWSHVSWHAGWVRPGQTGRLAATHWKWRLELDTLEECDTPTMVCD